MRHGAITLRPTGLNPQPPCLARLEAYPDTPDVVVDLSQVSFLDSRGMAVLVDLHGSALQRGGKLTLLGVPRRVLKALHVAGLDQVFQVEPA